MHSCPPDNWRSIGGEWDPGSNISDDGHSFFYHKWYATVVFAKMSYLLIVHCCHWQHDGCNAYSLSGVLVVDEDRMRHPAPLFCG